MSGSLYFDESILYFVSFGLSPKTCASTVIARPSNLLSYASLIVFKVVSQSFETYIWSSFNPLLFYWQINYIGFVDNRLSP